MHPVPFAMRIPLVLALSLLGACQAQRLLVVTSEPPGAAVRLDGVDYGTTPVEIPFLHYGTRRVSLNLDGYLSDSQVIVVKPPWYGRFPIDLVSEILIPVGWKDVHQVHAVLKPGRGAIPPPDLAGVLERAEELRRAGPTGPQQRRSEAETPTPPADEPLPDEPAPDEPR